PRGPSPSWPWAPSSPWRGSSPRGWRRRPGRPDPSGHHFDLALLGVETALAAKDLLQRADRDLELVEARLPRRQALEPEARRQQRHQDQVVAVPSGEADQLVGDAGDHRQQQEGGPPPAPLAP